MTARSRTVDGMGHIAELRGYGILDSPNEPVFDELVRSAARAFDTPIALISLLDEDRQWFKARHGLGPQQTPRTISFCTHAIQGSDVFVVPDATLDERFAANPLVVGEPNIRFYAGAPLGTPSGRRIGTLCVIDTRPREHFSEAARRILQRMAREVMQTVENRNNDRMGPGGEPRRWTKRESRSPAWLETFVLGRDGREIPVVLTNLSAAGCRIRSSEPLTAGERICLKVPRLGRLAADIVWAEGAEAGARFVAGTDMWEQAGA